MSSRSTIRIASVAVALVIAAAATACNGGAAATSEPSLPTGSAAASLPASNPPTPDAHPSGSSQAPANVPTVEPTPDIGPFACTLPETGTGTTERAQIVDVRVGTHDGYDRVVFEFTNGIPAYTVSAATPPLAHDPSGLPLAVQGSAFWELVLDGGTRMMPDGTSSYDGQTDFTPGYPKLVELVESGDFEAVSSWYVGMSASSCIRVLTLNGPPRLVIDIEH